MKEQVQLFRMDLINLQLQVDRLRCRMLGQPDQAPSRDALACLIPRPALFGHQDCLEGLDPLRAKRLAAMLVNTYGCSPAPAISSTQAIFIRLLAEFGISTTVELDWLASQAVLVDGRPAVLQQAWAGLLETGCLEAEMTALAGYTTTVITTVRLTEQGDELCEAANVKRTESEVERISRRRVGDHVFEVQALTFALQARLRGWQVEVLPEDSPADLLLGTGKEITPIRLCLQHPEVVRRQGGPDRWNRRAALCAIRNPGTGMLDACREQGTCEMAWSFSGLKDFLSPHSAEFPV